MVLKQFTIMPYSKTYFIFRSRYICLFCFIVDSIFECTAEIDRYCMFVQSTDDDFNWGTKTVSKHISIVYKCCSFIQIKDGDI